MYTTVTDVSCCKVSLFIKFRIESLGTCLLGPQVAHLLQIFNDYKLFVTSRTVMLSYYLNHMSAWIYDQHIK